MDDDTETQTVGDGRSEADRRLTVTTEVLPTAQNGTSRSVVIVRPTGDLDLDGAPVLGSRLSTQLDRQRCQVVLDLAGVTFLSSAGIRVLVDAHNTALARGSTLCITGAGRRLVARPLEITGLDRLLTIWDVPAATLAARLLADLRRCIDTT